MGFLIDARGAAGEVVRPTVRWEDDANTGAPNDVSKMAKWAGKITGHRDHPQAELRMISKRRNRIVVYVSLGEIRRPGQSHKVGPGVVVGAQGSLKLDWADYFTLVAAVDEALARLANLQQDIATRLANHLAHPETGDVPVVEAKAKRKQ